MKIKTGTNIVVPIYAMHHNKDLFGEDADVFDPDRFLDGRVAPDQLTFHPFGAGPRICIGMRFAMSEIKVVMAKILSNFKITEDPSFPDIEFKPGNLGLLDYDSVRVRFQSRN